jgi:hypothetical protein
MCDYEWSSFLACASEVLGHLSVVEDSGGAVERIAAIGAFGVISAAKFTSQCYLLVDEAYVWVDYNSNISFVNQGKG